MPNNLFQSYLGITFPISFLRIVFADKHSSGVFNVFSKISSIKDKLKSYSMTPDKLCYIYYSIDESNLCSMCKTEYTKDNIICLIQSIISKTYRYDKNETDNIINLFRNYTKDTYEKLLLEYFSCNIFDYDLNHFDCKHDKTHNLFCDHVFRFNFSCQ